MSQAERELKVAFIYNFMRFTDWPEDTGSTLTLCVRGPDPFGAPLDALQGKVVGTRTLADTPGAVRQGVHLNMAVVQNKVTFEANLVSARAVQLKLNSQLLRLATEVVQ